MSKKINNILITGGCGYLGSQLIRDFVSESVTNELTIRIVDNMQKENYSALMNLPQGVKYQFIKGDILDSTIMNMALSGIDVVIHLAGIVNTPMSFAHPVRTKQVNHLGTARLIESCLETGVKRLIYASTFAVYGPGGPFNETDIGRPIGPYAQSKYSGEQEIESRITRGLEPIILRFGVIYGYAAVTRFDAVMNRFAYLVGIKRPLTLYGRGDQKRPFVHVRDASRAIIFCLKNHETMKRNIFNVVGENLSILDITSALNEEYPEIEIRFSEQDILSHLSFEANNEKLYGLGWHPQYSIKNGLGELIQQFNNIYPFNPIKIDVE